MVNIRSGYFPKDGVEQVEILKGLQLLELLVMKVADWFLVLHKVHQH